MLVSFPNKQTILVSLSRPGIL